MNILLVFVHRVLQEIAACFNTMHCKRPFYSPSSSANNSSSFSYLLKDAIRFCDKSSSQNLNLINVSSRPLPTSRQKVAVVVMVVKYEPLYCLRQDEFAVAVADLTASQREKV